MTPACSSTPSTCCSSARCRREPVEVCKAALEKLLRQQHHGIRLCEHIECKTRKCSSSTLAQLGCEGIVSKRLGSHYVFGRFREWIKTKNPNAPAVRREAEEDWR